MSDRLDQKPKKLLAVDFQQILEEIFYKIGDSRRYLDEAFCDENPVTIKFWIENLGGDAQEVIDHLSRGVDFSEGDDDV